MAALPKALAAGTVVPILCTAAKKDKDIGVAELLDAIMRRERAERDGGELLEYPSILKRVGIGLAQWEHAVRVTGRRFSRELSIMADMYEEARCRK